MVLEDIFVGGPYQERQNRRFGKDSCLGTKLGMFFLGGWKIGDLGHTDISQKWQILKSLTEGGEIKDNPAQEISLDRWKQYFQELYNNSQVDDNLPKSFSVDKKQKEIGKGVLETIKLILNCPFSKKKYYLVKKN